MLVDYIFGIAFSPINAGVGEDAPVLLRSMCNFRNPVFFLITIFEKSYKGDHLILS